MVDGAETSGGGSLRALTGQYLMAKRKKKSRRGAAIRTRVLVGLALATVSLLFAIALIAYLQHGNWQRPAAELASRMGRINHLAARTSVGVLGVVGSGLLALGLGLLAVRFLAGRRLPGRGVAPS